MIAAMQTLPSKFLTAVWDDPLMVLCRTEDLPEYRPLIGITPDATVPVATAAHAGSGGGGGDGGSGIGGAVAMAAAAAAAAAAGDDEDLAEAVHGLQAATPPAAADVCMMVAASGPLQAKPHQARAPDLLVACPAGAPQLGHELRSLSVEHEECTEGRLAELLLQPGDAAADEHALGCLHIDTTTTTSMPDSSSTELDAAPGAQAAGGAPAAAALRSLPSWVAGAAPAAHTEMAAINSILPLPGAAAAHCHLDGLPAAPEAEAAEMQPSADFHERPEHTDGRRNKRSASHAKLALEPAPSDEGSFSSDGSTWLKGMRKLLGDDDEEVSSARSNPASMALADAPECTRKRSPEPLPLCLAPPAKAVCIAHSYAAALQGVGRTRAGAAMAADSQEPAVLLQSCH